MALRVKRRVFIARPNGRGLRTRSRTSAWGLIALEVQAGDRVAIVGDPSPEWLLTDFAVQCLGAISFGLYPTSAPDEMEFVLRHAGASVLVAEDQEHVDKVLPACSTGYRASQARGDRRQQMFGYRHSALISLRELIEQGNGWPRADDFVRCRQSVRPGRSGDHRLHLRHQRTSERRAYTPIARLVTPGNQFFTFPELDGAACAQRRAFATESPV